MIDYTSLLSNATVVSVSDMVYDSLKEAILLGRLMQGQQLNEREISRQLDISVTPVKDALRRLEKEGLVLIVPRKGTYVAEGIMNSMEEISLLRSAMEKVAARLAAVKINQEEISELTKHIKKMEKATQDGNVQDCISLNREFHEMIRRIARNSYIIHQLKVIRTFELAIRKKFLSEKDELEKAYLDHLSIYKAIVSRDEEAAEIASEKHSRRTLQYIKSLKNRQPGKE